MKWLAKLKRKKEKRLGKMKQRPNEIEEDSFRGETRNILPGYKARFCPRILFLYDR